MKYYCEMSVIDEHTEAISNSLWNEITRLVDNTRENP